MKNVDITVHEINNKLQIIQYVVKIISTSETEDEFLVLKREIGFKCRSFEKTLLCEELGE